MAAYQNLSTLPTPPAMVLSHENFDPSLQMPDEYVSYYIRPTWTTWIQDISNYPDTRYHMWSPQQNAVTLSIGASKFVQSAFRVYPSQVQSTLDTSTASFIPSAQQQVSTTLNIEEPEFTPRACHASSTRPIVSFPPEVEDSRPVNPQQPDSACTSPPIVDVQTAEIVTDVLENTIILVKMPPLTTSESSCVKDVSTVIRPAVQSLVFQAQEDFDDEVSYLHRLDAEKAQEYAEDLAQRVKEHACRKEQRTTWLESRTEPQLEDLAKDGFKPYDEDKEVSVADMASKDTPGLFHAQGFYYPTPSNRDDTSPAELIPIRDVERFPFLELGNWEKSGESVESERQGWVALCHGQRTRYQPHHISFFGWAVAVKSTTKPATTIAILTCNLKNLSVRPLDGSWKSNVMAAAMLYLDPVIYNGELTLLTTPGASALENACTPSTKKAYSKEGWWWNDDWTEEEDVPDMDELDPYAHPAGTIIMNGVTAGFRSREAIIAAAIRAQRKDREARTTAFMQRMSAGRVPSRLGLFHVTQADLEDVPTFVCRPRVKFRNQSSTDVANSAAMPAAQAAPSPLELKLCAHDEATGFRPPSAKWSDDVEQDEIDVLPANTTTPTPPTPVTVAEQPAPALVVEPPSELEIPFDSQPSHDVEPVVSSEPAVDVETTPEGEPNTDVAVIDNIETPADIEAPIKASVDVEVPGETPANAESPNAKGPSDTEAPLTEAHVDAGASIDTEVLIDTENSARIEAPVDADTPVNDPELAEDSAPSTDGSRRASGSSTDTPGDSQTNTPPSSPELDPNDDVDSIHGEDAIADRPQPPPQAEDQPDSGHVEELTGEEEYRLMHGEVQPESPVQIAAAAQLFQTILDSLNAEMEEATGLTPAPALIGPMLPVEPVVQIPGLGMLDEPDVTSTAAPATTPQPGAQALIESMTPIRPAAPPTHVLQAVADQIQEIVHIIPGAVPGQPFTTVHRFPNGTMAMTLPGQRFGLTRSAGMLFETATTVTNTGLEEVMGDEKHAEENTPALMFVAEDPLPNRIIEEVTGEEVDEEIDGAVLDENVTLTRDTDLSNPVVEDTAEESAIGAGHTSPSSSSSEPTHSPSSANDFSTVIAVDIRSTHINQRPLSTPSMATRASAYPSMASLRTFADSITPSAYDQWPDFDSVCYPHIPPRTSSLGWNKPRTVPAAGSTPSIAVTLGDGAGVGRSSRFSAGLDIIGRTLMGRRLATTTASAATTEARSQDEILTRTPNNESGGPERPGSRHASDGSVASRMGKKTKGFFKKSIAKLNDLLGRKK